MTLPLAVYLAPLPAVAAGLKGKDAIVAGELFAPIKVDDDSTWSLSEGVLSLELQKAETQRWWPHVLVGAPKRDTTKLTPENSKLSDLDGALSPRPWFCCGESHAHVC